VNRAGAAELPRVRQAAPPVAAIAIVSILFVTMIGLSVWCLTRRERGQLHQERAPQSRALSAQRKFTSRLRSVAD
jgi:hypothetical protein